jgi:hypothetical protein
MELGAGRALGAVLVVLALIGVFLFAPIINYSFGGFNYGIGNYQVKAEVSPSFYALGCGVVYNPTQTNSIAGYSHSSQIWTGGEWRCKSSNSTSGSGGGY